MALSTRLLGFVVVSLLFVGCRAQAQVTSPVPDGATVERIATGFQFTEGPVWSPEGFLLFSDIPANRVYRLVPGSAATIYRNPSGNSNGLLFDLEGRLLLAQHGSRRVARVENGVETAVVDRYDGKRLNSPNDLTVRSDSSIYFTDPSYGIQPNQEELGFYGVYRIDPEGGLHLLVNNLRRPNGIAFSPDETVLYVSDTETKRVLAYDVLPDQTVANARVFALVFGKGGPHGTDGLEVDPEGRLYVAGPDGVSIYAPDGTLLDLVEVPGQTTNVALGDADGKALYITAGNSVYRIRLNINPPVNASPEAPEKAAGLGVVYPNPTRGSVWVTYDLAQPAPVTMTLLDLLGRPVRVLDRGLQPAGAHALAVDLHGLAAGRYVLHLQNGQGSDTRTLTVVR